ncbi:MAG: peptidylprolyl isomerase, partial [Nitratireductor sp.]|nr:peptidylprolyl isomerase [Nitratireductor sp.]
QKSTQDALFEIRQSGGAKPETTEYLIEQTIFVVPASHANDKGYIAQRSRDAQAFREQFIRCDETVKQAAGMRDVTVRKLPRVLEPQLPEEWSAELIALSQGGVTGVKKTDRGIEFLAICSKRSVNDDMAAQVMSQAEEFETFNERGSEISESYLAELKSKSQIIYR